MVVIAMPMPMSVAVIVERIDVVVEFDGCYLGGYCDVKNSLASSDC